MFFDDSLKGLKKELKAAGADLSFVKEWQKSYDKVRKQSPIIENQYVQAKGELDVVYAILKEMEQLLISCKSENDLGNVQKRLSGFAKEMKKYQNDFNCEFLVSKEDKDFHLTYTTIVTLCGKNIKEQKDVLILQSEIENLMSMTKEALDKNWPEYRAMAYFYIDHTDKEIFDLPHVDKVEKVTAIYEKEFSEPMKQVTEVALGEERASKLMEEELWI